MPELGTFLYIMLAISGAAGLGGLLVFAWLNWREYSTRITINDSFGMYSKQLEENNQELARKLNQILERQES